MAATLNYRRGKTSTQPQVPTPDGRRGHPWSCVCQSCISLTPTLVRDGTNPRRLILLAAMQVGHSPPNLTGVRHGRRGHRRGRHRHCNR
eukprot:1037029-Pyramimonas_sp.AAC.1